MQKAKVRLKGVRPLIFHKFIYQQHQAQPEDYLYLDGNKVIIPANNLMYMMASLNTDSAIRRLYQKSYKSYMAIIHGFVWISPERIPLKSEDGKIIEWNNKWAPPLGLLESTVMIRQGTKSTRMPLVRPYVNPPWYLDFEMTLYENDIITNLKQLKQLLITGGIYIGIGSWRQRYGRFIVDSFEEEAL